MVRRPRQTKRRDDDDRSPPSSIDGVAGIEVSSSLAGNSLARLGSDLAQLLVGLASATITARWLGPADKGTLSTLLLLGVLASYASSLGLGDASIILRGQGRFGLRDSAEAMVIPIAGCTLAGIIGIWTVALLADWSAIVPAVVAVSVGLPFAVGAYVLSALHNGEERLRLTSAVSAVASAASLLGYVVFLIVLDMGILGGALAAVLGSVVAFVTLFVLLRKSGGFRRPRWDPTFVRAGLRYGLVAEVAYLLVALSQRLDALLVYGIRGEGDAGRYSIALTLSQLVWYGSFALSAAAFPRIARVSEEEAASLTARMARISVVSSLLSAVVLVPFVPLVITTFLGDGFRGAIVPTMILVLGGVIWSEQWVLARASVARGGVRLYLYSFAASVGAMVLLDLVLVPRFGLIGAACASGIASLIGFCVCAAHHIRRSGWSYLRSLVPTTKDVSGFVESLSALRMSRAGP